MTLIIPLRAQGSTPDRGSSSSSTAGVTSKLIANDNLRLLPTERSFARTVRYSVISSCCSKHFLLFLNSLSVKPFILAMKWRFSSTVKKSIIVECWLSKPTWRPTRDILTFAMFWSKMDAYPPVTGISMETIFRVVVLPDPLGPSNPKI